MLLGAEVLGEYSGTVDDKRRLSLPSKLRSALRIESRDELTLARGLDGCLWLMTSSQWQDIESSLKSLRSEGFGFGTKESRAFLREFYRRTASCSLDSHGRISLPESLMALTGIEKDVIFIVLPERTEIWSAERNPVCETWDETAERLFG